MATAPPCKGVAAGGGAGAALPGWLWRGRCEGKEGRSGCRALPGCGCSCSEGEGRTEDVVVRSSPEDAGDGTRLRLAWVVSVGPRSPCSVGAKRDGRSTCWLWTGAAVAEAGEARERWRTAKQLELQKRKGGGKEKEVSELANSSGSAESKSCAKPPHPTQDTGENRKSKRKKTCGSR
ncbi:uncharacterized protein [Ciconia boyciana]|uniref:uncharacterized protein isoform X2 n=1 Tax=Ciconia boyciana TaxID=52775 RepID=UPI003BA2116A